MIDLLTILKQIDDAGATFRSTTNPTGKLILTVLGGIAQFEREIMLERQREGIAKAKAEKKYKGRKPLADVKREQVLMLAKTGAARDIIATQVGIGVASVYRIIAGQKAA
jgi:DNA invertase Pin-like site-specific DNA recombinase